MRPIILAILQDRSLQYLVKRRPILNLQPLVSGDLTFLDLHSFLLHGNYSSRQTIVRDLLNAIYDTRKCLLLTCDCDNYTVIITKLMKRLLQHSRSLILIILIIIRIQIKYAYIQYPDRV